MRKHETQSCSVFPFSNPILLLLVVVVVVVVVLVVVLQVQRDEAPPLEKPNLDHKIKQWEHAHTEIFI